MTDRKYAEAPLTGALNDPCPVCGLKPVKAVALHAEDADPSEGAVTVCFGCNLVQVIHDGMRCALTDDEADWLFDQMLLQNNVLAVAKMRAKNPMRVGELVREQKS